MKLINKIQQKIYEIWQKAKRHISSFVGGQFGWFRYQLWLLMTNKRFNLKLHGDSVEKQKYDAIDSILPMYKVFWSSYIGHDQKGNICDSNIKTPFIESKRKYVGQLYYSIMTSFIELNKLKTKLQSNGETIEDVDTYLELTSNIGSYITIFGKIFDKESKVLTELFDNKVRTEKQINTQQYYSGIRNFEQHSSNIPIIIEEGVVVIPTTTFLIENDRQSWFTHIDDRDVVFLDEFLNTTFEQLKTQVNNNLSTVKKWFNDNTESFEFAYPDLETATNDIILSAVTETYNHVSGLSQENRRERRKNKKK
jgi:hypothetical protein